MLLGALSSFNVLIKEDEMGGTRCTNGTENIFHTRFWLESPEVRACFEENGKTISKLVLERGSAVWTGVIRFWPWKCIHSRRKFPPVKIAVLHFSGDNYPSKLNIETIGSSEATLNFYQTKRRHIPEESVLHTHRPEILLIYRICLTKANTAMWWFSNKQREQADQNLSMQPADWVVVPAAKWECGRIMEWRIGVEGTAGKITNG